MTNPRSPLSISVALACALLALSACGSKDAPKPASQVAAKVGSEEISVHQINQVLNRNHPANASPAELSAMARVVLERLIDQQLAVDQALQAKLNRAPEVVTQIEASRRDILASAYIQQISSSLPRPSADETHAYFAKNPMLFAQRRQFRVEEVVVAPASGVGDALRGYAANGKSAEDVAAWLKSKSIPFTGGGVMLASEQIPLESLAAVHALKEGQTTVLESATALTYLHLVSFQAVPVKEAVALPRIAQFLLNQRINTAVSTTLQQLRASQKIVYVGEFAQPANLAAAAAPTPAQATPVSVDTQRTALEKGVAGLK